MKKKILSLMLAVVMMMSLGVTARAETGGVTQATDGSTDVSTVTISKVYTLEGTGTSPAETFYLVQTAKEVTSGNAGTAPDLIQLTADSGETLPDVSSGIIVARATFSSGWATVSGGTADFTITLPTYEKVGVYTYTLAEYTGNTAGVTYSSNTIKLVVTVLNGSGTYEGNLVRVVAVYANGETTKSDSFSGNTYSANNLSVAKTVTGNLGDKTEEFTFTVTFTVPSITS